MDRKQITAAVAGTALVAASLVGALFATQGSDAATVTPTSEPSAELTSVNDSVVLIDESATESDAATYEAEYESESDYEVEEPEAHEEEEHAESEEYEADDHEEYDEEYEEEEEDD